MTTLVDTNGPCLYYSASSNPLTGLANADGDVIRVMPSSNLTSNSNEAFGERAGLPVMLITAQSQAVVFRGFSAQGHMTACLKFDFVDSRDNVPMMCDTFLSAALKLLTECCLLHIF